MEPAATGMSRGQAEVSRVQLYVGGALEAGQADVGGGDSEVTREGEAQLQRRERRGGVEQRVEAAGVDPVDLPRDADVEEVVARPETSCSAAERGLERAERDVVEGDGDLGEARPEVAPPARDADRGSGGADGAEAAEDLEKQIVWQGADEVGSSVWDVGEGEGDLEAAGPEVAPPAGEDARARGGGGVAAETIEDLEKQRVREGADEIKSGAAWT